MSDECGRLVAVCVSQKLGMRKSPVDSALLIASHGLEGDAHAGPGHRQVSLLAMESIQRMRDKGLDVGPGDFAENLTTEGLAVWACRVGDTVRIGEAVLRITQIGKECHSPCAIYHQAGECVMPTEGVFAVVEVGGVAQKGMAVTKVRGEGYAAPPG